MYRKRNLIIKDFKNIKPIKSDKICWKVAYKLSGNSFLMYKFENGVVSYSPLLIHTFKLIAPRKLAEAQELNLKYSDYKQIDNIPMRLRWCRHHIGLMQDEVAEKVGITSGQYKSMENGKIDFYDKSTLDKLAKLFNVKIDDLLDDYNRFLYKGQGDIIHNCRINLGLGINDFAKYMGVTQKQVKMWETEQKRISKRMFKCIIKFLNCCYN